jgi:glycosyltransferase involved in cell wall biosynthesis
VRARKIAIFDYKVTPTNPAGSCHLRILRGLSSEHEFTVFSVEFVNPCPDRIRWVRVPVPTRPAALLFVAYHLLAPICYLVFRLRHRARFDLIQIVESNVAFGDVSYSHFCHRAYLKHHWQLSHANGILGLAHWLAYWLHSLSEPWTYRRVKMVVVPSEGLARELVREYPVARGKVRIVRNAVDVAAMVAPPSFDREDFRKVLGLAETDIVLVFVALGHFEQKGLPHLLTALQRLQPRPLKLLVVGGEPDVVRNWRLRTRLMGLGKNVQYVGFKEDVRPYLWAVDAAVLPSSHETFSLVAIQSLAAGLPLVATHVYGVEEVLKDGVNGIFIDGFSAEATEAALLRFVALGGDRRHQLGLEAQRSARRYDTVNFLTEWEQFYADSQGESPNRG